MTWIQCLPNREALDRYTVGAKRKVSLGAFDTKVAGVVLLDTGDFAIWHHFPRPTLDERTAIWYYVFHLLINNGIFHF